MNDDTYNGWSNYETWCVVVWLNDKPSSYKEARVRARQSNAQGVETYISEMVPNLGVSMFSDLLGAALKKVNWAEMAERFNNEDR